MSSSATPFNPNQHTSAVSVPRAAENASAQARMAIVGGGGYLGQMLARELQNEGHFVVLLDLVFTDFPHIQLEKTLTERIKGSVLDKNALRKALVGSDAVFHLAGYGMSGSGSLERDQCFAVNVHGTEMVIEACRMWGVARLLFTSSVAVIFDGHNELHWCDEEETPYVTSFLNPYMETKCIAEKLILAANTESLVTCALRLRGIYGPGELRTVKRCTDLCALGLVRCTFTKSRNALTQYSSAENSVHALMQTEKSLRKGQNSLAAGSKYNIVDEGTVNPWHFWFPLIAALGYPLPSVTLPYSLVCAMAWLFEFLYTMFGVEPLFTRYEAALTAITNTYSIRRAQRDIGYAPLRSHDLRSTIEFCQQQQAKERGDNKAAQGKSVAFCTKLFATHHWIIWLLSLVEDIFWAKGLPGMIVKCGVMFGVLFLANGLGLFSALVHIVLH